MAPPTSLRAQYARRILREHVLKKFNAHRNLPSDNTELPERPVSKGTPDDGLNDGPPGRVCIIGAGTAGLQVALLLLWCGFSDFDILEASDRVGGRAFTFEFDDKFPCTHNYYDAGAMRIPQIDAMDSMFNMISFLKDQGVTTATYTYNAGNEPSSYDYSPTVLTPDVNAKFDDVMKNILSNFNIDTWLAGDNDNWSTRMYLMHGLSSPFTYGQTVVAETFDTSTGLFEEALTETILDYSDFQNAESQNWYRIEGGMSQVPLAMYRKVQNPDWTPSKPPGVNVTYGSQVVGMIDNGTSITVQLQGGTTQDYSAVFNTTTFGCLGRMDLSGLNIPVSATVDQDPITLIRTFAYDRATKVAIKFTEPWWTTASPPITDGGISNTDLPISNVIYPSWNDGNQPHVIIVSYSWAQDASRMASLIPVQSSSIAIPDREAAVVQQCFKDLALLWGPSDSNITVDYLEGLYANHHAWAWSHDPYTAGAFALFGPGQFKNQYPQFLLPLDKENKLMICGEAMSTHHAWISGALDSAYNAFKVWCNKNGWSNWEAAINSSPFAGGEGYDTQEIDDNVLYWHAMTPELGQKLRK